MTSKTPKLLLVGVLFISVFSLWVMVTLAGENEEAIKIVLKEFERLYNTKDTQSIVSLYHPSAKIKTGMGQNQRIVSREEYAEIVPDRVKLTGPLTVEGIQIWVKGNQATVNAMVVFTQTRGRLKMTYSMILDQGKWLIMVQDY